MRIIDRRAALRAGIILLAGFVAVLAVKKVEAGRGEMSAFERSLPSVLGAFGEAKRAAEEGRYAKAIGILDRHLQGSTEDDPPVLRRALVCLRVECLFHLPDRRERADRLLAETYEEFKRDDTVARRLLRAAVEIRSLRSQALVDHCSTLVERYPDSAVEGTAVELLIESPLLGEDERARSLRDYVAKRPDGALAGAAVARVAAGQTDTGRGLLRWLEEVVGRDPDSRAAVAAVGEGSRVLEEKRLHALMRSWSESLITGYPRSEAARAAFEGLFELYLRGGRADLASGLCGYVMTLLPESPAGRSAGLGLAEMLMARGKAGPALEVVLGFEGSLPEYAPLRGATLARMIESRLATILSALPDRMEGEEILKAVEVADVQTAKDRYYLALELLREATRRAGPTAGFLPTEGPPALYFPGEDETHRKKMEAWSRFFAGYLLLAAGNPKGASERLERVVDPAYRLLPGYAKASACTWLAEDALSREEFAAAMEYTAKGQAAAPDDATFAALARRIDEARVAKAKVPTIQAADE